MAAPQVHVSPSGPIEADNVTSDDDSIATDFQSIASTIPNFVYENGRRYHARYTDRYLLPNDEREQERLDYFHHVFRLTLDGGLCFTQLDNPQRILDVGTGTGLWAIEMAELYPSAEVVGTDLSPIQPGWAPDNVHFMVDDAEQEWAFPDASFDFIHIRTLGGSISDWKGLLKKCYSRLRPGGQVEVAEGRTRLCCDDNSLPEDSYTQVWAREFHRLNDAFGCDFDIFPKVSGLLRDTGFSNVEVTERVVPFGTWPKDRRLKTIGRYFQAQFLSMGLESYTMAIFSRVGGWTESDMKKLMDKVTEEMLKKKMHLYTHFSFATARKPLSR